MRTKQHYSKMYAFSTLTLLVGRQEGHPACKKTDWWDAGVFICLERSADLHTAQLMPLPLTVSCSSKSRLVLPFWYWLTRVVPDKGPLNGWVGGCVCMHYSVSLALPTYRVAQNKPDYSTFQCIK